MEEGKQRFVKLMAGSEGFQNMKLHEKSEKVVKY